LPQRLAGGGARHCKATPATKGRRHTACRSIPRGAVPAFPGGSLPRGTPAPAYLRRRERRRNEKARSGASTKKDQARNQHRNEGDRRAKQKAGVSGITATDGSGRCDGVGSPPTTCSTASEQRMGAYDDRETTGAHAPRCCQVGPGVTQVRRQTATEGVEMKTRPLPFDATPPARPAWAPRQMVTVKCAGCPTTATEVATPHAGGWPHLPVGWSVCGETTDGAWALWCSQRSYERRFDRLERATVG
jgi:hypothetical protein